MSDNLYAPPQSPVADVSPNGDVAPPLWNPNAAASWSLLFTPVFGAYLQMRNWQAMGQHDRAKQALWWIVGYFLMIAYGVMSAAFQSAGTGGASLRGMGFLYLIIWYFVAARPQVRYVEERYGGNYPRRPWLVPILVAFGAYVAFFVMLFSVLFLFVGR